jgi:NhaA family Na+:H+ antiporter
LLACCIPLERLPGLVNRLHDPVNFIIMPIFALSNTAIIFPPDMLQVFNSSISYGILAGLVIGKPLGIFGFSWIAAKLKLAALPYKTSWSQLLGVGIIAGIGFTMSIFISTLAYTEASLQITAKIAIIAASLISGIVGYCYLNKQ